MKKILTLLLIMAGLSAFAQQTSVFVNPEAKWNVAATYPNANPQNPNFVETSTLVYGYLGDTLINNQLWLKIYSTPDSAFLENHTYLGNIREGNERILFMNAEAQIDTVYDFNLSIGDSVFYEFETGQAQYLEIQHVDSIIIKGEYHKRFHFQIPDFPPLELDEVWIEGLGSVHGPLFPANPQLFSSEVPDSTNLTCFELEQAMYWNNPFYEQCYISIILSAPNFAGNSFKIYPNPVEKRLRIEFQDDKEVNGRLYIYDFTGKIVYSSVLNKERFQYVNTSLLKQGIYLLEINTGSTLYRNKLIKR
ncbi:MAG: T9SS type A sorting domain-containing protein [Bacteroidales bacterium]|nr:T9SS type A sorting domain-containing protein [Bacteroidales bacterium]